MIHSLTEYIFTAQCSLYDVAKERFFKIFTGLPKKNRGKSGSYESFKKVSTSERFCSEGVIFRITEK